MPSGALRYSQPLLPAARAQTRYTTTIEPTMIWARRVPLRSRQRSTSGPPTSPRRSVSTVTALSSLPGQYSRGRDGAAGRPLGDAVLGPALLGGLDVGALLAVVRRDRARAPADLSEVVWNRVLVLVPAPQPGRAELGWEREHPLLERLRCELGARHLEADGHHRHLAVDDVDEEGGLAAGQHRLVGLIAERLRVRHGRQVRADAEGVGERLLVVELAHVVLVDERCADLDELGDVALGGLLSAHVHGEDGVAAAQDRRVPLGLEVLDQVLRLLGLGAQVEGVGVVVDGTAV